MVQTPKVTQVQKSGSENTGTSEQWNKTNRPAKGNQASKGNRGGNKTNTQKEKGTSREQGNWGSGSNLSQQLLRKISPSFFGWGFAGREQRIWRQKMLPTLPFARGEHNIALHAVSPRDIQEITPIVLGGHFKNWHFQIQGHLPGKAWLSQTTYHQLPSWT